MLPEYTWIISLGGVALVALGAYCYMIYKYVKLHKERDQLLKTVSEQKYHINHMLSDTLKMAAETKQIVHMQSEQPVSDFEISYDPLRDANTATRIINRSALEIASHMITENCINVDIVPSYNDHKKIIVSADVVQSTKNKLHPSAQLLNLLMKNK